MKKIYVLMSAVLIAFACSQGAKAKEKPNYIFKDTAKGPLAKIDGQDVTEDELMGEEKTEFMQIKRQEYEMRMQRLNALVTEKFLSGEAKKENLSVEEYIDKKFGKDVKTSDAEIKKFIAERGIPESQLKPEVMERIKMFVGMQKKQDLVQAYVQKVSKGKAVEVYFSKPKNLVSFDVEVAPHSPRAGKDNAKVTVVEYSDFQCPYCSKAAKTVSEIKKKYGSKVRFVFRHMPLGNHPAARPAAEASMCMNDQSSDKFWKFHDYVFANQGELGSKTDEFLKESAKKSGADMKKFEECFKSNKFKAEVDKDMAYAESIKVRSTPTFFIGREMLAGALPAEEFE